MNVGVILAGGSGSRMNSDEPKQFMEFAGMPLMGYSLKTFNKCKSIDNILVVCKEGWEDEVRKIAKVYDIDNFDWIVKGVGTHQESLTNALEFLKKHEKTDSDIVVIHNANRPLVTGDIIEDSIRICKKKGNGISALNCVDSMVLSENGEDAEVFLDREKIVRAQSPQSFYLENLYNIYMLAKKDGLENRYECELMVHYGNKIHFSKGIEKNIKVTTPEDIPTVEAFLREEIIAKEEERQRKIIEEKEKNKRALQKENIKMMDVVMEICKKHKLTLYLAYGTLLGAERHKGFIPWDDDIDLMIYQYEYRKLEEILPKELPEEYFMQTFKTDKHFGINWMKIRKNNTTCTDKRWNGINCHGGISLDIFQISRVPDGHIKYKIWKFFYKVQHSILDSFVLDGKPSLLVKKRRRRLYEILMCIPYKIRFIIAKALNPIVFGKGKIETKRSIAGALKEIYPTDVFEGKTNVLFEDKLYTAPQNYKAFLTCRYGSYMALPPLKERKGHNYINLDFNEQKFYPIEPKTGLIIRGDEVNKLETIVQKIVSKEEQKTLLGIGPMSEAVIEASLELSMEKNFPLMYIASRNQVDSDDFGAGYVNNWNSYRFGEDIKRIADNMNYTGDYFICRDHGGPWQRDEERNKQLPRIEAMEIAKISYAEDVRAGFDLLHIDPTKIPGCKFNAPMEDVFCEKERLSIGRKSIYYEVGTEETNGGLTDKGSFEKFIKLLLNRLKELNLPKPIFVVGQTGTLVKMAENIGKFEPTKAKELVEITNDYGIGLKEHNCDYIPFEDLCMHPEIGVTASNVAPEFGHVETRALLELYESEKKLTEIGQITEKSNFKEVLFNKCLLSGRWKKWLIEDYTEEQIEKNINLQEEIINLTGHYCFNNSQVIKEREKMYLNLQEAGLNPHGKVIEQIKISIDKYATAFNLTHENR